MTWWTRARARWWLAGGVGVVGLLGLGLLHLQQERSAESLDPGWKVGAIYERRSGKRQCEPLRNAQTCESDDRSPRCEWTRWVVDDAIVDTPEELQRFLGQLRGKPSPALDGPLPAPFERLVFEDHVHAPYTLVPPLDWKADPYREQNWRRQFQDLRILDELTEKKGQVGLNQAAYLVLDWGKHALLVEDFPDFTWGDHPMATRSQAVASFLEEYLARHPDPNFEVARMAVRIVMSHVLGMAASDCYTARHNHGLFQDTALLAVARTFELPSEAALVALAEQRIEEDQILQSVSEGGIQVENSTSYALGYSVWVSSFVTKTWLAFGRPIPLRVKQRLIRLNQNLPYFVQPGLKGPSIGDSRSDEMRRVAKKILRETPGELMPKATRAAFKYFLDGGPAPDLETDFISAQGGYATLRSAWTKQPEQATVVHTKASRLTPIHAHQDATSFELYALGSRWIVDAGRYGAKDEAPFGEYQYGVMSHNVLVVDQKPTQAGKAPRVLEHEFGARQSWVRTRHFDYAHLGLPDVTRTLLLSRPTTVLVVDEVKVKGSHELTQHFHLGPELLEPELVEPHVARVRDGKGSTLWIVGASSDMSIQFVRGSMKPVQGWYFPDLARKVSITDVQITMKTPGDSSGRVYMHALLWVARDDAPPPQFESVDSDSAAASWSLDAEQFTFHPERE